jgi:hypothetical protein
MIERGSAGMDAGGLLSDLARAARIHGLDTRRHCILPRPVPSGGHTEVFGRRNRMYGGRGVSTSSPLPDLPRLCVICAKRERAWDQDGKGSMYSQDKSDPL